MKEPKFERRHYCAIAEVIRELGKDPFRGEHWKRTKILLGNMFAADNPRFSRGKFEEACEP